MMCWHHFSAPMWI